MYNNYQSSYFSRLFAGRLNRAFYWEGAVVILIAAFVIFIPLIWFINFLPPQIGAIVFIVFPLFLTVYGLSLGIRRLHDLNKSGYLMLLYVASLLTLLVATSGFYLGLLGQSTSGLEQLVNTINGYSSLPYVSLPLGILQFVSNILSLYLAFWPGTKGSNKYGASPSFLNGKQTFKLILGLK